MRGGRCRSEEKGGSNVDARHLLHRRRCRRRRRRRRVCMYVPVVCVRACVSA